MSDLVGNPKTVFLVSWLKWNYGKWPKNLNIDHDTSLNFSKKFAVS